MILSTQKLQIKFLFLFFLVSSNLLGQAFESKHISFRDGLPGRLVLDVYQEESGLIWMVTEKGIARYDGYEFLGFDHFTYSFDIAGTDFQADITPNDQKKLAIIHGQDDLKFELFDLNILASLKVDFEEFGTKPLAIYNQKGGTSYFALPLNGQIQLYKLTKDKQIQLLFSTHLALADTERLRLFVDDAQRFWINKNNNHIKLLNAKGVLIKDFYTNDFSGNPKTLELVFIFQDQQKRIWVSLKNEQGVYLYDADNQKFVKYNLIGNSDYFAAMWEDAKGNLLFKGARHQGNAYVDDLICLRPSGQQFSFDYLASNLKSINDICSKDFFEGLIVGAPNGLTIIKQKPAAFKNLLSKTLQSGDWGRSIRGITGDGAGNIFIGTETNELFQYVKAKDSIFQLPLNNVFATEDRKYFGGRNIFLDENQQIWSLSNNSDRETYFHQYDLKNQSTFSRKIEGITTNYIYDGSRYFYFTVYSRRRAKGKLLVYDSIQKTFSNWQDAEGKDLILETRGRSIGAIKRGILWIGTINGLIRIDLEKNDSELIHLKKENDEIFDSQEILAITETKEGLWLGTTKGIVLLDLDRKVIVEGYQKKDGLVDNSVCGIVPDSLGNFWLSTFDGLSYFDRKQHRFYNFYESDGLSHYEFNRMSFYQDEDNRFYFGGMNGINAFDGPKLLETRANNQLILTKFLKSYANSDSSTVQLANLDPFEGIVLPPNYSYFEFHFAMPNFLSKEIRYSAWLENYEKDWNYLGNNPKVRYNKLPAGNYTLRLKAIDDKGNPAKNELTIPIFVEEVFYKQGWFQLLMLAICFLTIMVVVQYHANQQLKVERLRTKLSSDLHDEVSGLLAGIAMQTDLMQMLVHKTENRERLQKIGVTSRNAMTKMADVIWSIDARKDKMDDLIIRMQEHAAEILQPLGINYYFDIGSFNRDKKLGLKLRQNLYLIFKEAVNNIAKHSSAKNTQIVLKNIGNQCLMSIKNDGTEKPKPNTYKSGQGLSNLKMRSKEINADLNIFNLNGFEVLLKVERFA